jgi:hypothetical protein
MLTHVSMFGVFPLCLVDFPVKFMVLSLSPCASRIGRFTLQSAVALLLLSVYSAAAAIANAENVSPVLLQANVSTKPPPSKAHVSGVGFAGDKWLTAFP